MILKTADGKEKREMTRTELGDEICELHMELITEIGKGKRMLDKEMESL